MRQTISVPPQIKSRAQDGCVKLFKLDNLDKTNNKVHSNKIVSLVFNIFQCLTFFPNLFRLPQGSFFFFTFYWNIFINFTFANVSFCCVRAGEGQQAGAAQVGHAAGEGLQPVRAAEPGGLGDLPELRPGERGGRPLQGGHLQEAVGHLLRGLCLLLPGLHLPVLWEGEHVWYVCFRTGRAIHYVQRVPGWIYDRLMTQLLNQLDNQNTFTAMETLCSQFRASLSMSTYTNTNWHAGKRLLNILTAFSSGGLHLWIYCIYIM